MANELPLIGLQAGAGTFTNASGGDLLAGALVVRDPAADSRFKTTTALGDVAVLGVLVDAITNGNSGRVLLDGVITMDVTGSVARGQFLKASTLAGAAVATSTYGLGVFGVALDASAGGQVKALVFRVERSTATTPHDLFADHDVALLVSDAGGLTVDFEGGQVWAAGTFSIISSGSIGVTNNDTTYVFVNSSGVVAVNTVSFPIDSIPLAVVVASGGSITSINDRRSYLVTGVHGLGTGGHYGNMYGYDVALEHAIAGTGIGNKVQVTAFAVNGESLGTTPDHTNDHITINNTGDYLVIVAMAVESAGGASYKMGFACYKNNGATLFQTLHGHRDMAGGGGEHGSITMSAIVALTAADTLEVWIWNETNTTNIIIDDISLSVVRADVVAGGGGGSAHDADQIIDLDTDTSIEVERGADDDTIRLRAMAVDVAQIASAGQWQLPVPGVAAGLLLGEDVHLYRAAADLLALATGDNLDLVQGYIQLEDMTTPTTPDFGDMKFFVRVDGGSIQLIGKGPTGEECVICNVSNTASAPNTLARNWIG